MYFVTFAFLLSPEWLGAGMFVCPGGCAGFWVNGSLLLFNLPVLRSIWQQWKPLPGPSVTEKKHPGLPV